MSSKTLGRGVECDVTVNHESVSRVHVQIHVTEEGYLAIQDENSHNGTFLNRNNHWIRIKKVILGAEDRIRFGDEEIPLDTLVAAFGQQLPVRLREGYSVRGKPLVFDQHLNELPKPKTIIENPRRNPITGNIEENR